MTDENDKLNDEVFDWAERKFGTKTGWDSRKLLNKARQQGIEAERKRIIDDIGHQRPHTPEEDDFLQRLLNHLKNSEAK